MSGGLNADQIAELIASHISVSTATFEGAGGVACVEGIGKAAQVIAARIDEELTEARTTEEVFDLRWQADRRAIKMWQAKTGRIHTWRDHADLCVFLLDELDRMTGDGSHRL